MQAAFGKLQDGFQYQKCLFRYPKERQSENKSHDNDNEGSNVDDYVDGQKISRGATI